MDSSFIILVLAALGTSILSAIVGMAGGLMLLGVMTMTLPTPKVVPLHGVVQLFSNATRTLVFLGHVRWSIVLAYTALMVPGMAIAVTVWSGASLTLLKPVLGVFILIILLQHKAKPVLHNPPLWVYAILGAVTGFLSIFVGAVGPILAPFFLRDDFGNEATIGTKAACQAVTHIGKLPAFLALGYDYLADLTLLAVLAATVIVGTVIGKMILRHLSTHVFRIVYKVALALLALYLIIGGLAALFA